MNSQIMIKIAIVIVTTIMMMMIIIIIIIIIIVIINNNDNDNNINNNNSINYVNHYSIIIYNAGIIIFTNCHHIFEEGRHYMYIDMDTDEILPPLTSSVPYLIRVLTSSPFYMSDTSGELMKDVYNVNGKHKEFKFYYGKTGQSKP